MVFELWCCNLNGVEHVKVNDNELQAIFACEPLAMCTQKTFSC